MQHRLSRTNIDADLPRREFLNRSKLDLSPARYEFGGFPVRPAPVPGRTPLV